MTQRGQFRASLDNMHGLVQASVASNLSQEERQRLADEIGSLIGRIV